MRKLTILAGVCAAALMFFGTAMAAPVPYPLQFDADGSGGGGPKVIWGWDLEGYAKYNMGGPTAVAIVTHQFLGEDHELSNNDTFYEELTLEVIRGLDRNGNGVSPYYSNLYIDIHFDGYIDNVSGPGAPPTAGNPAQILQYAFDSHFTGATATMYVDDGVGDPAYDLGETVVATFGLVDAGPLTLGPSIFAPGGVQASMSFSFGTSYVNTDYFGNAPGYPNFLDSVTKGLHLTTTGGDIAFSGDLGSTTTPEAILLGWRDTGFDATFTVVPEPSTILLLGCGLVGVAVVGKKRFSQK